MRKTTSLVVFFVMLMAMAGAQPALLPEPRHMQMGKGTLTLARLRVAAPPGAGKEELFALEQLKKWVGRGGNIPFSYVLEGKGDKEYYRLSVKPSGVKVVAHTAAGLFYAVQTLRQLGPVSPELEIEDQPALAYRGVMMDFAHGSLLTVAEIERQIDFLARWKTNQYYFYNEVSIKMKGYESLNIGAAYTQAQIKEIVAYGKLRQMDVVPFVAFYGHLHDLLKREKYASMGIGRYGEELDPRNPKVQAVLSDWIAQYAKLFTSPFVHVGFDETWETNRIAHEVDSNVHSEQLWLQHLDFVQKEWKKYGKQVLAWTDMNNYYPDIMSRFPKEAIPVIWEYSPDTNAINHYLEPVLKEGRSFFIQNAVSGWGHIYPSATYTCDNMDLTLKEGMGHGTMGYITSVWTDAVEPFIRPSWLFMAYGCIGAWQGISPGRQHFMDQYCGIVYPHMAGEMKAALDSLAASIETLTAVLGKNTSNLPGGTIIESWSNPFSSYYLNNSRGHLAELKAVRRQSEEAEAQLVLALEKTAGEDSVFIRSLLVSAQLVHYTASRFLWAVVICDRWNEAMLGKKKNDFVYYDIGYICHGYIQDMMDEAGELKDAYAAAWLSESQPYRLNTMLGRWNVEYELWQKLLLKLLDYRIGHDPSFVATGSFEETFNPNF
jgi:hexosaminidase